MSMSEREVLADALALIAKSDEAHAALPGILTTPESVHAYDVAADAAVHFLRDHGQAVAAALAPPPTAELAAARAAYYKLKNDPRAKTMTHDPDPYIVAILEAAAQVRRTR